LKLKKKAGAPVLASSQITLESNYSADGASDVWGVLDLLKIDESGNVISGIDGTTVIAQITEDAVTDVNFVIDFESGEIVFYSSEGEITHRFAFSAPENSGAESTLEWQKLLKRYMLYFRANSSSQDPSSALLIYGLTVAQGNIFE
jgi:hypothetical protein